MQREIYHAKKIIINKKRWETSQNIELALSTSNVLSSIASPQLQTIQLPNSCPVTNSILSSPSLLQIEMPDCYIEHTTSINTFEHIGCRPFC